MRIVKSINTFADSHGRWRAEVTFLHTLSESDTRPQFNLEHRWPAIRAAARKAILAELVEHERKVGEPHATAEKRIRDSLSRLIVIAQNMDAMNRWYGVTLGEPEQKDA